MSHNRIVLLLYLAAVTIYSTGVFARSDDSTKPISIKANSAEINDATGTSVYSGDIKITQGSMQLTGSRVTLKAKHKKVQIITAEGNPSTFKQTTDDGEVINAKAGKMVYDLSANKIVLTKNAKLTGAGNAFSSDRIVFHTDTEIVSAGSSTGSGRVNITVPP